MELEKFGEWEFSIPPLWVFLRNRVVLPEEFTLWPSKGGPRCPSPQLGEALSQAISTSASGREWRETFMEIIGGTGRVWRMPTSGIRGHPRQPWSRCCRRGDPPALLEGLKDVVHSTRRPSGESLPFRIHRMEPKVPGTHPVQVNLHTLRHPGCLHPLHSLFLLRWLSTAGQNLTPHHFPLLKALFLDFSYTLASHSLFCRPIASGSPGSLMDLQDLGLRPRLTELGLHFYTTLGGSVRALKSEKPDLHHSSPLLLLPSLTTLAWSLHVCAHPPLLMLEILCPPPPFCLPISLGNLIP